MKLTRQCFIVSREFALAFSREEVEATYHDMEEMGISKPPYPDFDIIFPANLIVRPNDTWKKEAPNYTEAIEHFKKWKIKIRVSDGIAEDWFFDDVKGGWWSIDKLKATEFETQKDYVLTGALRFIVVALATRNVIKETCINKAAKLGIGKNARASYISTTTLKVGEITESVSEGNGTHASPRPHLRRGHIRRQHYGPNHELVKKVWIQPTFVNADETFIERRTAYNLSPVR